MPGFKLSRSSLLPAIAYPSVTLLIKISNRDSSVYYYVALCLQLRIQAFIKELFQWQYIGTEEDIENQRFQAEYDQSPLIETIKKLVKQGNGHWEGSAQEIKDASKYLSWEIYDDVRKIGKQINRYEPLLHFDGIKIDTDRSSRGRKYIFNVIHDTNVIDDTNNTNMLKWMI